MKGYTFKHFRSHLSVLLLATLLLVSVSVQAQPTQQLLKINVFAFMSPEIEEQAEALSTICAKFGLAPFPLNGYQIHCTLYMTDYAPDKVDTLKQALQSLAFRLARIPVTTTGLYRTDNDWLFLNVERSPALQALSDVVVKKLSPWRAPKANPPDWIKDNPVKLENFMKYGSPNVFAGFEPHLTLLAKTDSGKLNEIEKAVAAQPELNQPVRGYVAGIGMAVADRNGQMKEAILIQPFKR